MSKVIFILPPKDQEVPGLKMMKDYLEKMGPYPPLNLLFLSSVVKNNFPQIEIKILDGQFLSQNDIKEKLSHDNPDFVGISPSIKTYNNALEIARFAKSLGSDVVFGGPHASGLAKEILLNRGLSSKDYCVDAVIQGDGEDAIRSFISGIDFEHIDNLAWQDKFGQIIENNAKSIDINKAGFIDRNFVDIEKYFEVQKEPDRHNEFKRGLTLISQRGCAWRCRTGGCIFCSRMNRSISTKSPKIFWDEMMYLVRNYNTDFLWDVRDDFLDNEKWLEELVAVRPSISKSESFKLQVFARIDRINNKTIKLLSSLNLPLTMVIGFESGSSKMLKTMNKGYSSETAMKGMESLVNAGIRVVASFVLGSPGENEETLLETLNFAKNLRGMGAGISPHILEPLPNSRAFELVMSRNNPKYANKDLMNIEELIKDWVSSFCDTKLDNIEDAYRKLEEISRIPVIDKTI